MPSTRPPSADADAPAHGPRPWPLYGAMALALLLRLAAVTAFQLLPPMAVGGREPARPAAQPPFPDSLEYLSVAGNIAAGRGLMVGEASQIGRMPGYPAFLAATWGLCGGSLLAARVAQAVVGTVAVWLAWRLGRSLYGEREGLASAWLLAVYPFVVAFTPLLLAETVFAALLLWGMLSLRAAWDGRSGAAALAGLAFGLATLVRASLLPGVLLFAVLWVLLSRFAKGAVGRAALMVAVFAAVMAPWVVRNYFASGGHLVPTTLRAGPSLYEALNPEADGGPMMDRIDWGWGAEGLSEYEQHRLWQRRAVAWARANPGRVLELAGRKAVRFWNPIPNAGEFRRPLVCAAVALPYVAAMVLAAVGLAGSWRRANVHLILLLPVVYHALLHMVFVSSIRYRMPVMPFVLVVAGHGLVRLAERAGAGRATPR